MLGGTTGLPRRTRRVAEGMQLLAPKLRVVFGLPVL
jgi:hypothetical protein